MNLDEIVKKPGYKISYDKAFFSEFNFPNLKLILRRALCGDPNPKTGEFLYYRILENTKKNEKCIQLMLFYNFQKLPPHKHDYHSFLLFLDEENNVKSLIYDKGHHRSRVIYSKKEKNILIITVFMWDHRFIVFPTKGWKKKLLRLTSPLKYTLKPLDPKQIWYFWTITSMAQLKIRSKLIDPWDPRMKETFRDIFKCPICGKEHHMDYMDVDKEILTLTVPCNGHSFVATNDLKNQKLFTRKIE